MIVGMYLHKIPIDLILFADPGAEQPHTYEYIEVFDIKDRTAESVIKALNRIERKYGPVLFRKIFQTITLDNGGEFADVDRLERSPLRKTLKRTKVYFCHP